MSLMVAAGETFSLILPFSKKEILNKEVQDSRFNWWDQKLISFRKSLITKIPNSLFLF